MKPKVLNVKGIHTPGIIIYAGGFFDGRIKKTAARDPDSGQLVSAYIAERVYLFNQACIDGVIRLIRELGALRVEAAANLLNLEEQEVYQEDSTPVNVNFPGQEIRGRATRLPTTAEEAQAARQAARSAARNAEKAKEANDRLEAERQQREQRRKKSLLRLTEIHESIIKKELSAEESFSATAEALKSQMCTYAHGALRTPVSGDIVPELPYKQFLEEYREAYRELDQRICKALAGKG